MPARNIVVVCSGSHEKKVNLGEVLRTRRRSTLVRSFHEKKVNLGEVLLRRRSTLVRSFFLSREEGQPW
jgi:hypothetical protein